jgi:hypothetical protein
MPTLTPSAGLAKIKAMMEFPDDEKLYTEFNAVLDAMGDKPTLRVVTGVGKSANYTPKQYKDVISSKTGEALIKLIKAYMHELEMEVDILGDKGGRRHRKTRKGRKGTRKGRRTTRK